MKIVQILVAGITLLFMIKVIAADDNFSKQLTPAQDCQTLSCVRNNIDLLDHELVQLIGKRLAYVKRAGEIKGHKKPIHDQAREDKILLEVGKQAEKAGYSGTIATEVFKTILAHSNIYESHVRFPQNRQKPH